MLAESRELAVASDSKPPGYGYELSLRLAREQLATIDIAQQCHNSGAVFHPSRQAVELVYLNQPYLITVPGGEISTADSLEEVQIRDKILILHYFITAQDVPISHNLISYKELPEGAGYYPTFSQRAIKPFVKAFGGEPQILTPVAEKLGGRRADFGDVSATINAFPRVPVTFVLWRGDAEFPPEGNILLDRTISHFLPPEDIIVVCETVSRKLVKLLKEAEASARRG
jgi:hypothetical protein